MLLSTLSLNLPHVFVRRLSPLRVYLDQPKSPMELFANLPISVDHLNLKKGVGLELTPDWRA
jgi:hypothetical protein